MYQAYGNTMLARVVWRSVLMLDGFVVFFTLCTGTFNNGGGAASLLLFLAVITGLAFWYVVHAGLWFEWQLERRWKRTCAGLGGNFVGEGRPRLHTGVSYDFIGMAKKTRVVRDTIYPKLSRVQGDYTAWSAVITPMYGQSVDDYNENADRFALAFNVPYTSFDLADNGLIRIRAGRVPVPEPFEYEALPVNGVSSENDTSQYAGYRGGSLLAAARTVSPGALFAEAEAEARALLQAVPMAIDIDGRVWHMPIEEQHVLIAARTGGGKGSFCWSLVLRLEPAWRAGLVKFWGCDPKRLELAIGREWWEHYADTDVSMVELLEQAVSEMYKVGDQLKGKARRFTPSKLTPLNVVVIDELGYLSSLLGDKRLQTRADNAIRQLLNMGRANSFSVLGLVQDPRKSVVDYRDSFPIRIAGGLDNADMVDLVLGKGMHEEAHCERIPIGKEGAGVAYVLDAENMNKPRLVRAAWVSDSTIRNALNPSVRAQAEAYEAQDEYIRHTVPQLGLDGKPLGQFRFRVE